MRVRAAGALLLAPLLSVIDTQLGRFTYERGSFGDQAESVLRALFWIRDGAEGSQPVLQAVTRDAVFLVVVVVALVGMSGLRAGRVLVALAAVGLAVLYVPSLIWPVGSFDQAPPDWVREYQPWFLVGRAQAVLWIGVLLLTALLAATSRAPVRGAYAEPGPAASYPPGPYTRPPGPVAPAQDPDRTLVQEETGP